MTGKPQEQDKPTDPGKRVEINDLLAQIEQRIEGGTVTLDEIHRMQGWILQGLGQAINDAAMCRTILQAMAQASGMRLVSKKSLIEVPGFGMPGNGGNLTGGR